MTAAWTSNQIVIFLVVLARVSGLVLSAPVLGDKEVPRVVKAIVALALTVVLVQLPALALARVSSALLPFALTVVAQLLVGISLGLVARLLFFAVQTAGEIVSLQIGLSAASVYNPMTKEPNPLIGQLFTFVAVLIFLALNGDALVVAALARSFDVAPLTAGFSHGMLTHVIDVAIATTQLGLQIAMPIIASLFAATAVLGVISRSLPQLNVFVLSMPLNMMIGLLVLGASLTGMSLMLSHLIANLPNTMFGIMAKPH